MSFKATVAKLSVRSTWCGPYGGWLQYEMPWCRWSRKHFGPDLSFSAGLGRSSQTSKLMTSLTAAETVLSSEESQKRMQMGHKHLLPAGYAFQVCTSETFNTSVPLELFLLEGISLNHHVMVSDRPTNDTQCYQSDPVLNLKSWKTFREYFLQTADLENCLLISLFILPIPFCMNPDFATLTWKMLDWSSAHMKKRSRTYTMQLHEGQRQANTYTW